MWPHSGSGAPAFPEDSYVIARHSLLQVCVEVSELLSSFVFHASSQSYFQLGSDLVFKLILPSNVLFHDHVC